MGATADYMTLEDGDVIDVAMYSDKNFYKEDVYKRQAIHQMND